MRMVLLEAYSLRLVAKNRLSEATLIWSDYLRQHQAGEPQRSGAPYNVLSKATGVICVLGTLQELGVASCAPSRFFGLLQEIA